MSKLTDWQAQIAAYITDQNSIAAFLNLTGKEPYPSEPEPDWQTIARAALKIALAAEVYCDSTQSVHEYYEALVQALKELQS